VLIRAMRLARWTIASPKRLAPLCGYKVAGEPRAGYRAGFGAGAITRALKLRHTQSSGVAHKSCGDRQIMRKALQFQDGCHRAANLPRRGCPHP